MSYRRVKHQVSYAPSAIYQVEERILETPRMRFFGPFPAPGPKPPKEAFLRAAEKLRSGVTKEDEFMVGDDWRVKLIPVTKDWEIVDVLIFIELLEPEVHYETEDDVARHVAEDILWRKPWDAFKE